MSSGKGVYWANKMLDLVLGGVPFTPPANVYLALYNANPSSTGGGTEVAGNNYARALVANNASEWPAAVNGQKSNANPQFFPAAVTPGWGYITAAAIFDASTGGNLLYYGTLTSARLISDGDTAQFPAGAISIVEG